MKRRGEFQAKLRRHFLSKMFPGTEDVPSEFATEEPKHFDHELPEITVKHVEDLRQRFPDLAKSLQPSDYNAIANLLAKSMSQKLTAERPP